MTAPRIGVAMWPIQSWRESRELWSRAEQLGFEHAWVYDHVAWRGHTPWYDGYSTLAAAAAVTTRIGLGTLVTTPNFRHPVPTAHAVRAIDDISEGRLRLGIGSGGGSVTSDGGRLGGPAWSTRERADRFEEWVTLLDALLRGPETSYDGRFYSARAFPVAPAPADRPRPPFALAANGPRGLRLAARFADTWITTGEEDETPFESLRARLEVFADTCAAEGRDAKEFGKLLLTGFTNESWLESAEAFRDLAGRYAEIGITDIVVHWPRPGSEWGADMKVFEQIAAG
jgi:alkanesulfonate monooxygenase SsuD/methylene tetrahydromethanopterin reductase-like flavin-dependent oxidoreductase (luciferase family)